MGDSSDVVRAIEEGAGGVTMIQSTRPSIIGRIRTCATITFSEWALVVISLITILTGFGFSLYRWTVLPGESLDLVFSILVFANLCFATYYLFHGIFQQQPFELVTLILTTALLWILIAVNFISSPVNNSTRSLNMIRFIVASVMTLPNLGVGGFVAWRYWTTGNLVFKTVGADATLQYICRQLLFELSLIAFDAQAAVSCLILVFQQGLGSMTNGQLFIAITGIIFVTVWGAVGYIALRTENRQLTWLFGVASLPHLIYVVYLFVQAMDIFEADRYSVLSVSIYVSGITLTLTHLVLLAMLPVVAGNFGKGLKEKIYGALPSSGQRTQYSGSGSTASSSIVVATDSASSSSALLRSGHDDQSNYDSITVLPY